MTLRWRHGIAFPLILSLALGGLSAWLGRISEVEVEEVKLNPNEPQYSISGIHGKHFDEQGRLKENLTSSHGWQLPESDDIHFAQPQLLLYKEGELQYRVNSNDAVYNSKNKQVVFDHDVVLTKNADSQHPEGIFKTDHLYVNTETKYAQTESPVTFEYGRSHGSAVGMTYDHNKGLLNFPSRVKATIYDAKNI